MTPNQQAIAIRDEARRRYGDIAFWPTMIAEIEEAIRVAWIAGRDEAADLCERFGGISEMACANAIRGLEPPGG